MCHSWGTLRPKVATTITTVAYYGRAAPHPGTLQYRSAYLRMSSAGDSIAQSYMQHVTFTCNICMISEIQTVIEFRAARGSDTPACFRCGHYTRDGRCRLIDNQRGYGIPPSGTMTIRGSFPSKRVHLQSCLKIPSTLSLLGCTPGMLDRHALVDSPGLTMRFRYYRAGHH